MRKTLIRFGLLLTLVIGAHVALWQSGAPQDMKLRLTLINAAAWAVILLPAIGVGLWLKAHRQRRDVSKE